MKSILCLTVCALSLLAFASTAQSEWAEARGDFDFDLSGTTGVIEFNSEVNAGIVNGRMSFSATIDVENPDGNGGTVPSNLTIGAVVDCMLAHKTRAAMSGVISQASVPGYIGRRVLLVVQDKVENIRPTTHGFAWGVYQPTVVNTAATDYDFCPAYTPPTAEELGMCEDGDNQFPCPMPPPPACNFDGLSQCSGKLCNNTPGASLTWTATDYELCPAPDEENPNPPCADDPNAYTAGIPATPTVVDCESFPLAAFPLNLIPNGGGNKVVVKVHH